RKCSIRPRRVRLHRLEDRGTGGPSHQSASSRPVLLISDRDFVFRNGEFAAVWSHLDNKWSWHVVGAVGVIDGRAAGGIKIDCLLGAVTNSVNAEHRVRHLLRKP